MKEYRVIIMKLNTNKQKQSAFTRKRIIAISIIVTLVVLSSAIYIGRNTILQAVLPKKYVELSLMKTIKSVKNVYATDEDKVYDKKYYFELVNTDNDVITKVASNLSTSVDVTKDKSNHIMNVDLHMGIKGINFVNIDTYTDGSVLVIDTNKKIGGLYSVTNSTLSSYLQDKGVKLGEYEDIPLEKLFANGEFLKSLYNDLVENVKTMNVSKIGEKEIEVDIKTVKTTIYRLQNDKYCVDTYLDNEQNVVGCSFTCTVLDKMCKITITNDASYDVFSKCNINIECENKVYDVEYSFMKVQSEVSVIATNKAINIDDIYNFDIKELIPDKVKDMLGM